jgi:hypothetical protein
MKNSEFRITLAMERKNSARSRRRSLRSTRGIVLTLEA